MDAQAESLEDMAIIETGKSLPAAMNQGAEVVRSAAGVITRVLRESSPISSDAFLVSAIKAANALDNDVDRLSVARCVFNAASLGLQFGPTLGHAYLVPFKKECTLIVGYKGFLDLAFRNRFIKYVTTEVVLAGEQFDMWVDADGRQIKHLLDPTRDETDDKNIIGAYCLYHTSTGAKGIVYTPRKVIEKAKAKYSKVWSQHYAAMAKKTAIRRAAKEWHLTEQMAHAVALDERAEAGVSQPDVTGQVRALEQDRFAASETLDEDIT